MPNWSESMQQTFEYYTVDPGTWRDVKRLDNVKSCTITRDSDADTLGSATIDITESVGECYIRVYLITVQNGVREKHPLGTFLVQTPSSSFNGKIRNVSMDAYTPLLELKEGQPGIGYFIPKGENVMTMAHRLARENARAPVIKAVCQTENAIDFAADPNDSWLSYLSDFMSNQIYTNEGKTTITKYKFDLDELGRITFAPVQDVSSLQPRWTFDDSNSSILYPELTMDHDLYGIPNVVEVIYDSNNEYLHAKVINDLETSPVSTVNRGRKITHRVYNPSFTGNPTQEQINIYAEQLLSQLSSPQYTVSYTHGYCPVRLDDCVRLNYSRAGIVDVKAKVISQSIKCVPGCPVTEKAVFTTKLWR